MTKTNIIIADTNIDLISELEQLIGYDSSLNLLASTNSGKELLDLINAESPHIIIMDLILRDLDGLDVLKFINDIPVAKRPRVLIVSSLWNALTLDIALQYNVHYYLLKPVPLECVMNRIKDFSIFNEDIDDTYVEQLCIAPNTDISSDTHSVRLMTSKLLSQLGFPVHMSSYNYLLYAVEIVVNDSCSINMVTKKVYPLVAAKYNTTSSRVERALRYLIEIVWKSIDQNLLYTHFALSLKATDKPSSSELIAVIADKIRLELLEA